MSPEFDADAGDRLIMQLMADRRLSCAAQLKPAARIAGQQLELMKPAAMAVTSKGIFAGPVVDVKRGQIVVVLADSRRVITVRMINNPDLPKIVDTCSIYMQEEWRDAMGSAYDTSSLLRCVTQFLKTYGAAPGKAGREMTPAVSCRLIGTLFAVLPDSGRAEILSALQATASSDVCPAAVCLIGKGSSGEKGTSSGAWPLMFALAPYVATIPQ